MHTCPLLVRSEKGLPRRKHALMPSLILKIPFQDSYIGGEDNFAFGNKYVQPCYAPTASMSTTEACDWGPVNASVKTCTELTEVSMHDF
jgi:hypothetical protein